MLTSIVPWLKLAFLRVRGRPLIVERHGGLGDLLCMLPAAVALRDKHPGTPLILVTADAFAPLASLAGVADCVIPSQTRGLSKLRLWLAPLLDIYPLLPDEQTPPLPRSRIHLVAEFAKALGVNDAPLPPVKLAADPASIHSIIAKLRKAGMQEGEPFAVAHTGPTWPVKQWPASHWADLAHRLQSHHGVRIVQAGADMHAGDASMRATRIPGTVDWVGRLTLRETLALMSLSKCFVGVDSGLLHLACSAGTPVVGLFGPTDPGCFLPSRSEAKGLNTKVNCIGCHHNPEGPVHWKAGCPNDVRCMSELSVEMVVKECLAMLT